MTSSIKYYQAAGITICLESDLPITPNTFHSKFNLFEVSGPGQDNVKIRHHQTPPAISKQKAVELFSNDQWKIYKIPEGRLYKFKPSLPGEPGCPVTALVNNDHTCLDIYIHKVEKPLYLYGEHNALTLFNSDQLLFSKLLCDRDGLIIHSNGFNILGKGILLAGKSGAGKSTLSKMIKRENHQILCDDRMFIKKQDNTFWIHGSWCHGSVPDVAKASAPLEAVFFLKHSKNNHLELLNDKKVITQNLIQALVKPFFDKEDWLKTLEVVNRLVKTVDFYYVHFDLSGQICTIIEEQIKTKRAK